MATRNTKKTSTNRNATRAAGNSADTVRASPSLGQKLDRIERQLRELQSEQHHLAEFEQSTEAIVERKVYEIKALSYVTLIVASVLLALVLGMTLNALGIRIG